tara:strand:+ start:256 stop:1182 length:927 start_codon:yes stop_codon:yes gene_type:complete
MIKKTFLLIALLFFFSQKNLFAEIKIIVSVDSEIITNHDLKKESNYLKVLNPNFTRLDQNQRLKIAKNYLIDQIIKEKEAKKFIKLDDNDEIINDYIKNFIQNLGFNNEEEFKKSLNFLENYSLSEIKEKIKMELLWNELIYLKYNNQVRIDKKLILKKVNEMQDRKKREFLLSEIVFAKKKGIPLKELFEEIVLSIKEIGFNNTANIYSNADSAKFGGKIGWISEISLAEPINKELKGKEIGQYTDLIKLGNNFLILKIEDMKIENSVIDKQKEIEKLIKAERNSQLNKFSKIYFNKVKLNYLIDEK